MNPAVVYLGVGALGVYGYATGHITNFIDNFKKNNKTNNENNENLNNNKTIIVHAQHERASNSHERSYFLPLCVTCFISLGGYYYYIHNNGTKKVIGAVEETAEETQTLVQKSDENNSKRFEILDCKNENRAQNLEMEIRSEQRAGFNVISEQLYCLTQVAIQTLSAIAQNKSSSSSSDHAAGHSQTNDEKLLSYCDKAQEMADTILSEQHVLKNKQNNLIDIKAEIQLRNQTVNNSDENINNITPGGPAHVPNQQNQFALNHNQNHKIINIQQNQSNQNDQNNIFIKAINSINASNASKIGYHVYNHKNIILLSTSVITALYIGNTTFNYYYYSNLNSSTKKQY